MEKIFSVDNVIQTVKENPITVIAIDSNGKVKTCIPLKESPSTLQEFDKLLKSRIKSIKGVEYSVSLVVQDKKYSKVKLLKNIRGSIDALRYSKTHKLKAGVNIQGNKKYYGIKKKLG